MIETASDFLEQFKKYALSRIEKDDKDIKHSVAIGSVMHSAWTHAGQPVLNRDSGPLAELPTQAEKAVDDRQRTRIRVYG